MENVKKKAFAKYEDEKILIKVDTTEKIKILTEKIIELFLSVNPEIEKQKSFLKLYIKLNGEYILLLPIQTLQEILEDENCSKIELFLQNSKKDKSFKETKIETEEQKLRIKLAACYRIVEMFGWSEVIYNHLTVRVPGTENHFLINPFGLHFSEITASSLVKIDLQGNIIDPGSTNLGVNKAGFVIHSAIHESREDLHAVLHTHSSSAVAISASCGEFIHGISQESSEVTPFGYHEYEGIVVDEKEKEKIVEDLGNNSNLMLKNHGILVCGPTLDHAMRNLYLVQRACDIQVTALSIVPKEKLKLASQSSILQARKISFNNEGRGIRELNALIRVLDKTDPSFRN